MSLSIMNLIILRQYQGHRTRSVSLSHHLSKWTTTEELGCVRTEHELKRERCTKGINLNWIYCILINNELTDIFNILSDNFGDKHEIRSQSSRYVVKAVCYLFFVIIYLRQANTKCPTRWPESSSKLFMWKLTWKIWQWNKLFLWETGHFPASYHSNKAA